MLSDQELQLLTAYVDGVLSQRQRKDVLRLLHRSSEAREMLGQLQEQAHRIKRLPRRRVEPSLAPDILQAIADSGLTPTPPRRATPRRRWAPYIGAAVAASLLLAPAAAFYFLTPHEQQVTRIEPPKPAPAPAPAPTPEPRKAPLPNPVVAQVIDGTFGQFAAPVVADRTGEPISLAFHDLRDEGRATGLLAMGLQRDKAVQLDITVKNNAVALERLRRSFEEAGIKVAVDPNADKALKRDPAKTDYLVYAENLAPDEVTRILRELSQDDKSLKTFSKSPFERLTLGALGGDEKAQISRQLGLNEPQLFNPVRPGDPPAKTETPAPKFNRWQRSAVVLPKTAPGQVSSEVRTFAAQRLSPQPGTVQVLIRIHQEK